MVPFPGTIASNMPYTRVPGKRCIFGVPGQEAKRIH